MLAVLSPQNILAASKTQKKIDKLISNAVGKDWPSIKTLNITKTTAPQVEIKVYDKGGVTPPIPTPGTAIPPLNKTKTIRVGVIGDVDNNNGLVTQLNLLVKYQVQYFINPGDFGYSSGQGVLDKLTATGFTKTNSALVLGNHDSCSLIKIWTGDKACFGDKFFGDKIAIFAIDGNSNFGCGTAQYDQIKSDIEGSDAWYNIPVVHQPFVTGPSKHPANGQQSCYSTLFANNGVDLVLQAHNHNYQRFFIDPIWYLVVGTGTHDSGSSMYSISSNAQFNGKTCSKCFTGTNGVEILDFQIDDPHVKHIDGYFLSNAEKVMDTFVINR